MAPRLNKQVSEVESQRQEDESQRQSADRASDRITVALIPKAVGDLRRLQRATGLSKTDIVNRAISLYEFFQSQVDDDGEFFVRDRKSGETQLVRFF